jgi:uncharacterized protein YqeY
MNTKQKLEAALLDAMRTSNEVYKRTIRMVLSSIKLEEVAKRGSLDESQIIAILQKEIKLRREAIEDARKANRPDLLQANEAEIAALETFLPTQLSETEVRQIAEETIAELNAASMADMGKVMKALLSKLQGRASNELAGRIVRQLLASE